VASDPAGADAGTQRPARRQACSVGRALRYSGKVLMGDRALSRAVQRRRSGALIALLLAAMLGAVAPGVADAEPSRKKAMWGPVELNGVSQFPIYADLGVGIFQMRLYWNEVAVRRPNKPRDPSDTAYRWPPLIDRAITEGRAHGIQVSLLVQRAPRWANGNKDNQWAPRRPADFAAFVAAASRRYPAVRHWMIWGEPIKDRNFQPLAPMGNRPLRGKAKRGARIYARLLDAAYRALKRVSARNRVIGGNSFTGGSLRPRRWIEALKLPNGRPPRMDLYGHNPFSARPPDLDQPPLGGGYADFADLDRLARWVDKHLTRSRRIRLFLSEYSLPTDHTSVEFNFYVSRKTQADWIRLALRETRRWSRIYTFGYHALYDDALLPDGRQVERGLIERDGTRKPAYYAFRRG
jgi:hypothetical protein